jgi:hypothetical protein
VEIVDRSLADSRKDGGVNGAGKPPLCFIFHYSGKSARVKWSKTVPL